MMTTGFREGEELAGVAYIFLDLEIGIGRVSFFLDDPAMAGAPFQVENNGPFDLAGGSDAAANPFNASLLSPGVHTVTAPVSSDSPGRVFDIHWIRIIESSVRGNLQPAQNLTNIILVTTGFLPGPVVEIGTAVTVGVTPADVLVAAGVAPRAVGKPSKNPVRCIP